MGLEKLARYKPGENVSALPTEDIVAGTFVMIAGEPHATGAYKVKPATANLPNPFGVAERSIDVSELDDRHVDKLVNVARRGAISRVLCEGAVAAGEEVYVSGAGKVKKIASEKFGVGRCVKGGTDTYIEVELF